MFSSDAPTRKYKGKIARWQQQLSGIVGNANSNLGRPPRPSGFKKRPNTAGAQPMGGLPIEEFLAVMNGGGDSGDLVGKLMQLGISLASNAG